MEGTFIRFVAELAKALDDGDNLRVLPVVTDGAAENVSDHLEAVESAFGAEVDYAMLHKIYAASPEAQRRYSPAECIGVERKVIEGDPDPKHISTLYAERQNLTMRMHMRRFTRLTNAFSKKFENHAHMVASYAVWYNWVPIHKTLRVTPAMAVGLTDRLWPWEEIIDLLDADQPAQTRGPYKKKPLQIPN